MLRICLHPWLNTPGLLNVYFIWVFSILTLESMSLHKGLWFIGVITTLKTIWSGLSIFFLLVNYWFPCHIVPLSYGKQKTFTSWLTKLARRRFLLNLMLINAGCFDRCRLLVICWMLEVGKAREIYFLMKLSLQGRYFLNSVSMNSKISHEFFQLLQVPRASFENGVPSVWRM